MGGLLTTLSGQVAIVTGANSGVGRSAAGLLARAGASVWMVCRSRERGLAARDELARAGSAVVELEVADLSDLSQVRDLSARLTDRLERVDILINNAGVWRGRREISPDGFELTFATNHVGHFLLTHGLMDALERGRGRIVNVSSEAHRRAALRRTDLEAIVRGDDWRGGIRAYGDSKLANILFTFELVRRFGDRLTANAVHPGVLATRIWNQNASPASLFMRPFKLMMAKPRVGGDAVMNLVGDPHRDDVTGRYFKVEDDVEPAAPARDETLARDLWSLSERLTGAAYA